VDQGELRDGIIAPSRGWLSPARALLLLLGAVLGGVLLSLALGASPAHAADGDGTSSGSSPMTAAAQSVSRAVVVTVSATTGAGIPAVERTVGRGAEHAIQLTMDSSAATIDAAVPAATPVIAPAVASVESTLAGALSATARVLQQLAAPVAGALDPVDVAVDASRATAAAATLHPSSAGAGQSGILPTAVRPDAQAGSGTDGALPDLLVSAGSSAPSAAVDVLVVAVALVLLAARRRILQNALPASPVFDTDTSPA